MKEARDRFEVGDISIFDIKSEYKEYIFEDIKVFWSYKNKYNNRIVARTCSNDIGKDQKIALYCILGERTYNKFVKSQISYKNLIFMCPLVYMHYMPENRIYALHPRHVQGEYIPNEDVFYQFNEKVKK